MEPNDNSIAPGLTLTLVVFECHLQNNKHLLYLRLTLTLVVFECIPIPDIPIRISV